MVVVAVMVFSLAFVSAGFNYHKIQVSNGTLLMDEHALHIPDGYEVDMDSEVVDVPYQSDENLHFSGAVFNKTDSSDYFSVYVTYRNDGKVFDYYYPAEKYVNVTINGVDGCLFNASGETIFSYVDEGDMIEIHSSTGDGIFEKIV